MKHVTEPARKVPVLYEADVVVAGGGISGVFSALAAARNGAETVLVERFGRLGGNLGPGMVVGGGVTYIKPVVDSVRSLTAKDLPVCGPLANTFGISTEFLTRMAAFGPETERPRNYLEMSYRASHVAMQMLKEAGVRVLLSTCVTDPIRKGRTVRGLFVENKSGCQAITVKVTIDATGEADLAFRAGAPVIRQSDPAPDDVEAVIQTLASTHGRRMRGAEEGKILPEQLRGRDAAMNLWFLLDGVDWDAYDRFTKETGEPSESDLRWYDETIAKPRPMPRVYRPFLPLLRDSYEKGEFFVVKDVPDGRGLGKVWLGMFGKFMDDARGMAVGRTGGGSAYDTGNGEHMSICEVEFRNHVFDFVEFLRRRVPGFKKAYVFLIAPFLGARGGRHIVGEYTLTALDLTERHRRFDDVIYVYKLHSDSGTSLGAATDVPYRILVPKGLDGLLATGRSASHGRILRARQSMMVMGEAVGTAAALCVKNNTNPRKLNVKDLQRKLLKAGFFLGGPARLRALALR